MTISIDSNIIVGLWDKSDEVNLPAKRLLLELSRTHKLVVSGIVFAELLGGPERDAGDLLHFFQRTSIEVDWNLGEPAFRAAGAASNGYWARRRKRNSGLPRRLLTDFLIGAHAQVGRYALLTLDQRLYRAAFPSLQLVRG